MKNRALLPLLMLTLVFAFFGCKTKPKSCFTVSFNGAIVSASADCSDNADTYVWDFGDGFTSIAANPSHEYATFGDYELTLQVTGDGGSDTYSQTINITKVCRTCSCWGSGLPPVTSNFCGTQQQATAFCSGCNYPSYNCGCN